MYRSQSHNVALRILPVESLFVDHAYQRPEQTKLVGEIVANLRPQLLGTPEVSDRGDGTYAIMDGQQRWLAVSALDAPSTLRCNVHTGLTREEEAELFVALNKKRKQVSALERFLAEVFHGEPQASKINELVQGVNMDIGKLRSGTPETRIEAVSTLERIVSWKPVTPDADQFQGLRDTLNVMQIWRGDPKSNHTHWIMGIAYFTRDYGTAYTPRQEGILANQVPARLIRQAVGDLTSLGGSGAGDSAGKAIAQRLKKSTRIRPRQR